MYPRGRDGTREDSSDYCFAFSPQRRRRSSTFPRHCSQLDHRKLYVSPALAGMRLTFAAGVREFAKWAPHLRVVPYMVSPSSCAIGSYIDESGLDRATLLLARLSNSTNCLTIPGGCSRLVRPFLAFFPRCYGLALLPLFGAELTLICRCRSRDVRYSRKEHLSLQEDRSMGLLGGRRRTAIERRRRRKALRRDRSAQHQPSHSTQRNAAQQQSSRVV